ncbi:hypothetical protein NIES4073_12740 [Kalymmatonema gypsitolerans NIES-4073]|nr:hypothetical protein NIES4073_12740 [Scytonema sp. NIES-4073]
MPKSKLENLMNARRGLDVGPSTFVGGAAESEPVQEAPQEQRCHSVRIAKTNTVAAAVVATEPKVEIDWNAIAAGLGEKVQNTNLCSFWWVAN